MVNFLEFDRTIQNVRTLSFFSGYCRKLDEQIKEIPYFEPKRTVFLKPG